MTFSSPFGYLVVNTTYGVCFYIFGEVIESRDRASATSLQLEVHADIIQLFHYNMGGARSAEVLGGSDRSRQSIKWAKGTGTLRELERTLCAWSGVRPRSTKAVAPNS